MCCPCRSFQTPWTFEKLFPVHWWEMCEVSVQTEDLIVYHEAPPTGSCFHCWSCSNGAYNIIHVLTWSKLFKQTVTSQSCTKIKQVFFPINLASNVISLDKIHCMYEKAILNDEHKAKWFHRILFQHTIAESNYKTWVHEWYGDLHVQVRCVTSIIVISYEIVEGHNPAV